MNTRSSDILEGPQWANVRALYKADGYAGGGTGKTHDRRGEFLQHCLPGACDI